MVLTTRSETGTRWVNFFRVTTLCTILTIIATVTRSTHLKHQRSSELHRVLTLPHRPHREQADIMNTIRVPTDMWRLPSQFPSWKPVPLPNCFGNADMSIYYSSETHSRKCPKDFKEDEEIVRYYGPGMGYTPDDLKVAMQAVENDIIIIGDSISRHWFIELSCYLGAFESFPGFALPPIDHNRDYLEADITEEYFRLFPHWGERHGGKYWPMNHGNSSAFGVFNVPERGDSGAPTQQRVIYHGTNIISDEEMMDVIKFYDQSYPKLTKREKPILIINNFIHYNGREGEMLMERNLSRMIRYCNDMGAKCIFRESSPQHFETDKGDGAFTEDQEHTERRCMSDPPPSFTTLYNMRNQILHSALKQFASEPQGNGFVKVMYIFDRLAALSDGHNMRGHDCTHFVMNPEIWEPWQISLTEVLMNIASEVA